MVYWPFTLIYLALGLAIGGVEIYGALSKREGDTISENWWWLDKHLHGWMKPVFRMLTAGSLVWLLFHLAGPWR